MTSNYRDDDASRLRLAVARISRHLRAVDVSSALTPTQASLLSTVVRGGRLGLSELSALEGVDAPTLSRAVSRLEEQGLFRRLPDPDDGRAVTVEATAAGKRLQQRLRAARADALQARLGEFGEEERRLLHDALPVLEAVADALKQQRTRA
jgi:DNA-binding MarR family transcriptional regulator